MKRFRFLKYAVLVSLLVTSLCWGAASDYKVKGDGTIYGYDIITKGPWIDSRAYATLELANAAAYNAGKLLVISQNYTLEANTVLTASIMRIPGGSFTKSSTYTLTFNGTFQNPSNGQCFIAFAAGDVSFVQNYTNYEWFTNLQNAVSSLSNGGTVYVHKSFTQSSKVVFPYNKNIKIKGEGRGTIITSSIVSDSLFEYINTAAPQIGFEDIYLLGPGATSGDAIHLKSTDSAGLSIYISNVKINNFAGGVGLYGYEVYNSGSSNLEINDCDGGISFEHAANANSFFNTKVQWNLSYGAKFKDVVSIGWYSGLVQGNFKHGLVLEGVRQFYGSSIHFEQNNYGQTANTYSIWVKPYTGISNSVITLESPRFAEQWGGIYVQGESGMVSVLHLNRPDIANLTQGITRADVYSLIRIAESATNPVSIIDSSGLFSTLMVSTPAEGFGTLITAGSSLFLQNNVKVYSATITQATLFGNISPSEFFPGLYTIIITQGGAGSYPVTWGSDFINTWSNTGNTVGKTSQILFIFDGTKFRQIVQVPYY